MPSPATLRIGTHVEIHGGDEFVTGRIMRGRHIDTNSRTATIGDEISDDAVFLVRDDDTDELVRVLQPWASIIIVTNEVAA